MRRKTELVKDCFAVFMVALIKLLIQSYGETHPGCAPLHMLRSYMLLCSRLGMRFEVRQCRDTAGRHLEHKVRGGKCVGAVGAVGEVPVAALNLAQYD